jgi:hypothetical protein
MSSFIKKPFLHGLGCHPFCELSGSGGFPSKMVRRVRRHLSTPSLK